MAVSKPVELRCDEVILVRWLTSNPQHFNPRNATPCVAQLTDHWPHVGPKSPRT